MPNIRSGLMSLSIGQSLFNFVHHKAMPKIKTPSQEADEFGQRLRKLMADAGVHRHGAGVYLHDRYGVSTVTANAWLNGEHRASTSKARRIAEDHGSTFDELYFGSERASAIQSRYRIASSEEMGNAIAIEVSDVRGSCGGGSIAWDEDKREPLLKEPSWFRRYKLKPKDAMVVWADGESMADFIVDGDIVIFDTSKTTPKSGRIFLIDHPDGLRIKRLRRDINGSWVLESANTDKRRFPDERIAPDQAELLTIKGEFVYRQGG